MIRRPLFWAEIMIMVISPYPIKDYGLNSDFIFKIGCINWVDYSDEGYKTGSHIYETTYFINDFFLAAMFLRLFFILQTLIVFSPPNNKLVAKRVCFEQGIDPDFSFQVKMAFKEKPVLVFFTSGILTVVTLAALLRIFERPYYLQNFPN